VARQEGSDNNGWSSFSSNSNGELKVQGGKREKQREKGGVTVYTQKILTQPRSEWKINFVKLLKRATFSMEKPLPISRLAASLITPRSGPVQV